jgi:hypothetical protein
MSLWGLLWELVCHGLNALVYLWQIDREMREGKWDEDDDIEEADDSRPKRRRRARRLLRRRRAR